MSDEDLASATERLRPRLTGVEMDDFIESCLHDNAVVSYSRSPNGEGFFGEGVTERDEQVMEECTRLLFEKHPNPPEPATDAEFMALYRLYARSVDCLRGLGLDVNQPSFETYRDEGGAWSPYGSLPEPQSAEEWERWNALCPQDPWAYESDVGSVQFGMSAFTAKSRRRTHWIRASSAQTGHSRDA
ncbi:MAG: hypothetical protein WD895_09825 [Acidimicrobiia bacterium]